MALTKIDDRGLNTPIDLLDNEKIRLGTGNDFKLSHDGSNSYLENETGDIIIQNSGGNTSNQIYIRGKTGVDSIRADGNGSVYIYDQGTGSASKKFETTSTGAQVTGALKVKVDGSGYGDGLILEDENSSSQSELTHVDGTLYITSDPPGSTHVTLDSSGNLAIPRDNAKFKVGAGADLEIYHDGTNSIIDNNTGEMHFIGGTTKFLTGNSETLLKLVNDGAVELYYNGVKKFETLSTGIRVVGTEGNNVEVFMDADEGDDDNDKWKFVSFNGEGALRFYNYTGGAWEQSLGLLGNGAVELYHDNSKKLETNSGGITVTGGANFTSGNVSLVDDSKIKLGTGDDLQIFHQASNNVSYIQQTVAAQHTIIKNTSASATGSIYIEPRSGKTAAKFDGTTGQVSLNYDGYDRLKTIDEGIAIYGKEGGSSEIYFYADEGDDDADKYRIKVADGGPLQIGNKHSGSWDTNIECNPSGNVELNYDNTKKFETTSGGVTVLGNLGFASAGQGIDFGATANSSGTMASELLDDYEVGTFDITSELGGFTISNNYYNKYVKIGSLVHIQFYIGITGTGDTNTLRFGGLPFAVPSSGYSVGTIDFGYGGKKGTYMRTMSGSSQVDFFYSSESASNSRVDLVANTVGAGYVIGQISYYT